jgi:hypothetical protein
MLKKVVSAALAAFLFGGCSTYNAFDMFKKDDSYEKALRETKNAQILNSFETKIKITATYLNHLYPSEYKDAEYFFVGVYIPDDYEGKKDSSLFNKEYKLYMQNLAKSEQALGGAKPKEQYLEASKIEFIEKKEQNLLYKKMPHTDNWSRYYLISFPKQEGDEPLLLKLSSPTYGEAKLSFPRAGLD